MMTCNATFGGVTCNRLGTHDGLDKFHRSGTVTWADCAPGAKPHEEPDPRYMTEISSRRFAAVVDTKTESDVATFWTGHPDRDAAAEREAARLNSDPDPRDAKIKELSERWGETIGQRNDALAERDEARAERDRVRDGVKAVNVGLERLSAENKRLRDQRGRLRADRDRYRASLNRIMDQDEALYPLTYGAKVRSIAREALDGEVTEEATYCNCSRREVDEGGNALHYHNCNSRGPR